MKFASWVNMEESRIQLCFRNENKSVTPQYEYSKTQISQDHGPDHTAKEILKNGNMLGITSSN